MKYRIAWNKRDKWLSDSVKPRRGEAVFASLTEAKLWAEEMNSRYPTLYHWVEPVPDNSEGSTASTGGEK